MVPLSDRLQAVFASRIAGLPEATRRSCCSPPSRAAGDVRVLREAAGERPGLADLAPAERAQLVRVDDAAARITFRHPLIRSAIVAMSTHEERRGAHLALADALDEDRERRAWHLAAAAAGPDEAVAGRLERRGASRRCSAAMRSAPIAALVRAAELSTTGAGRGRRLAEAAYIGAEASGAIGDPKILLAEARPSGAGLQRARCTRRTPPPS